jgi:hypothetical protein
MMTLLSRSLPRIAALLVCAAIFGGAHAAESVAKIVATLDALPAPITVNRFYESSLRVTDADGNGISGLQLQVRGRMPEHAHGLPSEPQITEKGQGHYQVRGLSFNMPGRWVIEILHGEQPVLRQELTVQF